MNSDDDLTKKVAPVVDLKARIEDKEYQNAKKELASLSRPKIIDMYEGALFRITQQEMQIEQMARMLTMVLIREGLRGICGPDGRPILSEIVIPPDVLAILSSSRWAVDQRLEEDRIVLRAVPIVEEPPTIAEG